MVIVNYKSKRELKRQIGKQLSYADSSISRVVQNGKLFFATNMDRTFIATVITDESNKILEVR